LKAVVIYLSKIKKAVVIYESLLTNVDLKVSIPLFRKCRIVVPKKKESAEPTFFFCLIVIDQLHTKLFL